MAPTAPSGRISHAALKPNLPAYGPLPMLGLAPAPPTPTFEASADALEEFVAFVASPRAHCSGTSTGLSGESTLGLVD